MRNNITRVMAAALLMSAAPFAAHAAVSVGVSIGSAPPPLPYYDQPMLPGDGYVWMPGYWAWSPSYNDYFWVPGTWVSPPEPGYLWTPGYWRASNGYYNWSPGYWGSHVGFYGGVNYGYGYSGVGYQGGYWRDRRFYYNRAVNNVNVTRVNVYNQTVVNNVAVNRVSYNGGNGGLTTRPTPAELNADREKHVAATSLQTQHEQSAVRDRALRASVNQGKPAIAATEKANDFSGRNVIAAREAGGSMRSGGARDVDRSADRPAATTRQNDARVNEPANDREQRARVTNPQEPREAPDRSAAQVRSQEREAAEERVRQQRAEPQEQRRSIDKRPPAQPAQERRAQEPPREVRQERPERREERHEERREPAPGANPPPQNRVPDGRPDDNGPR